MKFIRYWHTYIQTKIMTVIAFFIGFGIIIVAGIKQETKIMFLLIISLIFFVLVVLYNLRDFKEYITVDDKGVMCEKRGEILWKYSWSEIAYLPIGNPKRNPGVYVVLKVDCKDKRFYPQPKGSFQLTKVSKEALRPYCRKEKDKYTIICSDEGEKTQD